MDIALTPDQRVVTAVTTEIPSSCTVSLFRDMAVTRHLPDGSPDAGFGTDGVADLAVSGVRAQVEALALQPDGKILLAGSGRPAADMDFAIVRLLENGEPDPGFGTDGRVYVPVGSSDDYAMGIALQSDGKIVVAGTATGASHGDIGLVRVNANGTLDSTFGTGGVVTTDVGSGTNDSAADVVVQPDGRIVVGGSSGSAYALLRYTSTGGLDASFGTGGVVTRSVGAYLDSLGAVLVDIDGNVVAVGTSYDVVLAPGRGVVLRYLANGSPDPGFGGSGLLAPTSWAGLVFRDAMILPSHSIAIAGYANLIPDMVLASALHHGVPDPRLSADGYVRLDTGEFGFAEAIALADDGRIFLAGRTMEGSELDLLLASAFGPDVVAVPVLGLVARGALVALLLGAATWWSRRRAIVRGNR
jgi:uncharacterized delta-60 repeat protein